MAKDTAQPGQYWIRNEVGRVWGPFALDAVGRVSLGGGEVRERVHVSTDGRVFRPITEFPEVLRALELAAANAPPPRRFVAVEAPPPPPPPRPAAPVAPPPPPEDPGPPAAGTLAEHSSIELYARVASTRVSGRLEVRTQGGAWSVYFKKGTPERIEPPGVSGELAAFLVRKNVVSQDEADHALDITGGVDGELLDGLVSLELVPMSELFSLLGEFAGELLQRFIALDEGEFEWEADRAAPQPAFPLGSRWLLLSAAMRALAPGAVRRRLAKRALQAVYPSSGGRARIDDLGLTAQESRAVQLFDGTRSPELVARHMGGEREVVMRIALLLGELGCMSFGPALDLGDGAVQLDEAAPAMEKRSAFTEPGPAAAAAEGNVGIGRVSLKSVAVKKEPEPAPAPKAVQPKPVARARPPEPVRPPPKVVPASHVAPAPKDRAQETSELQALLEKWKKADHFEVLGVDRTVTAAQAKTAFIALARAHHPDTVSDPNDDELRSLKADVTARVNAAHEVLKDDAARAKYLEELTSGGGEKVDVGPILQAEEDFLRAQILVKARKYAEALELLEGAIAVNPTEPDFLAWRAWARFVSAQDKRHEYPFAMSECQSALKISDRCAQAHFFVGQMSKIVGEMARAEKAFKATLAIDPDHIEAKRELRLLGK